MSGQGLTDDGSQAGHKVEHAGWEADLVDDSARMNAFTGATSEGFRTTVHPAAMA